MSLRNKVTMITKFLDPIFRLLRRDVYCQDGLITVHNHDFLKEKAFQLAYERGVRTDGVDYRFHWRVHVALWASACASRLEGDFVECGVNRGFVSSAILQSIDWNRLGKQLHLLDTFSGPDERFLSQEEKESGYLKRKRTAMDQGFYATTIEGVRKAFAEWDRVRIIQGSIPETLPLVTADRICFLHLDLNCSPPEVAALDYFWDRLVTGAFVLLDDYAYVGFRLSKLGMDGLALRRGFRILSLPTGQGLIVKSGGS